MMHQISSPFVHKSFEPEVTLPLKLEIATDVYVVVSPPIQRVDTMIDVVVETLADMALACEFYPID